MSQKISLLQIIHLTLILGICIAYAVLADVKNIFNLQIDTDSLPYAFIPIGAYYLSNIVFKSILGNIKRENSNEEKITFYQSASIARWGILEVGCFVILFIKPDFALLGLVIVIYMFLIRPTKKTTLDQLNIKETEIH